MASQTILLDTHVWLWLNTSRKKLPSEILALLQDPEQDVYLSIASTWEIAIKYAAGKLSLPQDPARYVPSRMRENGVWPLPIRLRHSLRAATLPLRHRDPFDRMLVAQAQVDGLTLATADPVIASYDVQILWCSSSRRPEPSGA